MKSPVAIIAGVVAGLVGAAIWAAIAYYAQVEIGWIAWGIGILVGVAMVATAKGASPQLGVAAVIITILSLVGGKYAAIQLAIGDAMGDDTEWLAQFDDEQFMISEVADEIIEQKEAAGEETNWPQVSDPDNVPLKDQYPAAIWKQADTQWNQMSAEQKEQYKQQRIDAGREMMTALRGLVARQGFFASFGVLDLVFFGLAIFTAFRIAGGSGAEA